MNRIDNDVLDLLKSCIWGMNVAHDVKNWEAVFDVFKQHSILALAIRAIKQWNMPNSIETQWKQYIYQNVLFYHQIEQEQKKIISLFNENAVPVIILKGTATAQYYAYPESRSLGDIDLLVSPSDIEKADSILIHAGWTCNQTREKDRHICYHKQRFVVELHKRFASTYVVENPVAFDRLLFEDVALDHMFLNDQLNGLILMEHIAQHIREGIGLRHIIDWMVFVDHCMLSSAWERELCLKLEEFGLFKLAVTVTRMCQLFLGLRDDIEWCKNADDKLCVTLMEYVMECGNLGKSLGRSKSSTITQLPPLTHPIKLFRYLQERGKRTIKLSGRKKGLESFAFLFQGWHYLQILLHEKMSINTIVSRRNRSIKMFKAIGLIQFHEYE